MKCFWEYSIAVRVQRSCAEDVELTPMRELVADMPTLPSDVTHVVVQARGSD